MARASVLIGLLVLAGCSSARSGDAAVTTPAAEPAPPTSPAPPSAAPSGTPNAKLRVHYPAGGRTLGVGGEGPPLSPHQVKPLAGAGDTWEIDLGALAAPLALEPVLDDTPARGPAYVVHPGETLDIQPHFFASQGSVSVPWPSFQSQARAGTTRAIRTYLPPSYEENTAARYPVLYVHDGQYAFSTGGPAQAAAAGTMRIDRTLDDGIEAGRIAEVIVVAIDDTSSLFDLQGRGRIAEMTPTADPAYDGSGQASEYVAMILDEVKPMVDAALRTRPGRESTFMLGASLGGLVSAYAASTHPGVVGAFASMSGSMWWDRAWIVAQTESALAGGGQAPLRVYLDYGESEQTEPTQTDLLVKPTDALLAVFRDDGLVDGETLMFVRGPRGQKHDSAAWAARMPAALSFLVGSGR